MSANNSNRKLQRKQRMRKAPLGNSLSSVALAPQILRNPDAPFIFNRRCADITVWLDQAGVAHAVEPPGSSAAPFITFGSSIPEITGIGMATTFSTPWFLTIGGGSISNFTPFLNFFNEFQLRQADLEVQSLTGDSVMAAGGTSAPYGVPEVLSAVQPVADGIPTSIEEILAFPNTQRSTLTLARPHRTRFRPRPSFSDSGANLAFFDSQKDVWMATNTSVNNFGCWGWIRNWPTAPGATGPFLPIRFSLIIEIAGRRPR